MRHRVDNMAQSVADQRKMDKYQNFIFKKLPQPLENFHLQSKQVYFTSFVYTISTKSKFVQLLTTKKKHKKENPTLI